jgi:hypothetical protein
MRIANCRSYCPFSEIAIRNVFETAPSTVTVTGSALEYHPASVAQRIRIADSDLAGIAH